MASTNNTKILSKDYLAEQLYNYHKKFIIEGVKASKQDNLEIVSNHLTWENNNTLGINILNDSEAKQNDYIVLENTENGSLSWKTPIEEQEHLKDSELLVTGKAVFDFKGSTNINTLGTIKEGTWEVGDITLGEHNLTVNEDGKIIVGNFEIKQDGKFLQIKYADGSYLTLDSSGELNTESINTESIDTISIVSSSITADKAAFSDLDILNTIKINNFEIKQDGKFLQIKYADGSYLTLDSSGELNTASIDTDKISTTNFELGDNDCKLATEEEFDINNIEFTFGTTPSDTYNFSYTEDDDPEDLVEDFSFLGEPEVEEGSYWKAWDFEPEDSYYTIYSTDAENNLFERLTHLRVGISREAEESPLITEIYIRNYNYDDFPLYENINYSIVPTSSIEEVATITAMGKTVEEFRNDCLATGLFDENLHPKQTIFLDDGGRRMAFDTSVYLSVPSSDGPNYFDVFTSNDKFSFLQNTALSTIKTTPATSVNPITKLGIVDEGTWVAGDVTTPNLKVNESTELNKTTTINDDLHITEKVLDFGGTNYDVWDYANDNMNWVEE